MCINPTRYLGLEHRRSGRKEAQLAYLRQRILGGISIYIDCNAVSGISANGHYVHIFKIIGIREHF